MTSTTGLTVAVIAGRWRCTPATSTYLTCRHFIGGRVVRVLSRQIRRSMWTYRVHLCGFPDRSATETWHWLCGWRTPSFGPYWRSLRSAGCGRQRSPDSQGRISSTIGIRRCCSFVSRRAPDNGSYPYTRWPGRLWTQSRRLGVRFSSCNRIRITSPRFGVLLGRRGQETESSRPQTDI
jgi:hypothetical protein